MYLFVAWPVISGFVVYTALINTYCMGCPDKLDLVFVIDSSGSIDFQNFNILKEFIVQVTQRFPIGPQNTRVSAVRFSDDAEVLWGLDSDVTSSQDELHDSLMSIEHVRGKTYTSGALDIVAKEVLGSNGDREDVSNLVIVITDGNSNLGIHLLEEKASTLKQMSRVMAIGVTYKIDFSELLLIASTHCDLFHVSSFDAMDDDMDSTMDQICGCIPGTMWDNQCSCIICSVNTFQPLWGQSECLTCPPGTKTLGDGAKECFKTCNPGEKFNPLTESCDLCEIGTYQSVSDTLVEQCESCGPGLSTRTTGAVIQSQCEETCNPGEKFNPLTESCDPCEIGTYQSVSDSLVEQCEPCGPALSTRTTGAVSQSQCEVLCDAGQRLDIELQSCEDCPRGTYQPDVFADACIACPSGSSTVTEGATDRQDCNVTCKAGQWYNVSTGLCEFCPQGTYQAEDYALTCVSCDRNLSTLHTGATDISECIYTCGPGMEITVLPDACVLCRVGFYQSQKVGVQCEQCPDGTTTASEGATSQALCTAVQESAASKSKSNNAGLIAGVLIAVLVVIAGVILIVFFLLRRKKKEPSLSNLFVPPPVDKSHVYKDLSVKGQSTKEINEYDNHVPVYDTPATIARPVPLEEPKEPVYSNVSRDTVPAYIEEHEYSNNAAVKGLIGEGISHYAEGLDNPIYENHDEITSAMK